MRQPGVRNRPGRGWLNTREMIRLVLLVALNLALFQGAWWILISPPFAMMVAVLNLLLWCAIVRPGRLGRGKTLAMLAGIGVGAASISLFSPAGLPLFERLTSIVETFLREMAGLSIDPWWCAQVVCLAINLVGIGCMVAGGLVGASWERSVAARRNRVRHPG